MRLLECPRVRITFSAAWIGAALLTLPTWMLCAQTQPAGEPGQRLEEIARQRADLEQRIIVYRNKHPILDDDEEYRQELTTRVEQYDMFQQAQAASPLGENHPSQDRLNDTVRAFHAKYQHMLRTADELKEATMRHQELLRDLDAMKLQEVRLMAEVLATTDLAALDPVEARRVEITRKRLELEARMIEFRLANPTIGLDRDTQKELARWSEQYTSAQLDTIKSRARFGENHPTMQHVRQREQVLYETYDQKRREATRLNALAAEYATLEDEMKRLKQLEQELIERQRAATQPTTQPAVQVQP